MNKDSIMNNTKGKTSNAWKIVMFFFETATKYLYKVIQPYMKDINITNLGT